MEKLLQITVVRKQGFLVRRAGFSGVVRGGNCPMAKNLDTCAYSKTQQIFGS